MICRSSLSRMMELMMSISEARQVIPPQLPPLLSTTFTLYNNGAALMQNSPLPLPLA